MLYVGAQKYGPIFALNDINNCVSEKFVKKENSKPLTILEPKSVSTKAKSITSKKRKTSETPKSSLLTGLDSFDVERKLHELVTLIRIIKF